MANSSEKGREATVASSIADFIASQGVKRVYSLPGGHVKPIWSELVRAGVQIVSARHECAAVHMAHAEADLTGRIGVSIVTTGPGLSNAVTGMASAWLARTPLLVISARVPDPQAGMGALEEIPQADLVRPVCRHVREISEPRHVLSGLHVATSAALGNDGPPGPAYVDFATNILRRRVPHCYRDSRWLSPVVRLPRAPDPANIREAVALIRGSRRLLAIGGRGALGSGPVLTQFLRRSGCLYIDTRESRGTLHPDDPSSVPAMRARIMAEADLVITLGRRLDFELAFGSAAVFADSARFVRVGRSIEELGENRRGDVEICADVGLALSELLRQNAVPDDPDLEWRNSLAEQNAEKTRASNDAIKARPPGSDGRMHPLVLIDAVNRVSGSDAIVIVDGGDILSFSRVGLRAHTYMDLGPLGCLGSGAPYAVAASLAWPGRRTIAVIGDGSFGFSAMEVETAVRHGARALFVVANNDAWNIERHDQLANYGGEVVGTELSPVRYDRLAEAVGAYGERVESPADLPAALERALSRLPAVLDVAVTRDAVSPDSRSGLAKVPPYQAIETWDLAEQRMQVKSPQPHGADPRPGDVPAQENTVSVKSHQPPERKPARGYSEATSGNGVIAISGQLPAEEVLERGAAMAEQYQSALSRFVEVLAASGAGPADILRLNIFVTDMDAYRSAAREIGPAYRDLLKAPPYPAATLVAVPALIDPRAMVEIEGLAVGGAA